MSKFRNKQALSTIELIFMLAVIVILSFIAIPNSNRHGRRYSARTKACFSNQRIIQGAVEMYNMDVKTEDMMHTLDQDKLVQGNYLKKKLEKEPESSCRYLSDGDLASETSYIYCDYHGDITQERKKAKFDL
jgi:competence protein ComGC